ncbi:MULTISPECIES: TIGR03086 family metal-binding protein [Streptomyces]|uniref:TIGR03086 family metal-binding protein n=1 Tax=Streptomyces TaxID=1883 RepID=UPI00099F387C|nr:MULTISPECIES: TIGR03086 family metal-binding protein [Streptomyces]
MTHSPGETRRPAETHSPGETYRTETTHGPERTGLVALDRVAVQESLRVLTAARDAADWERPTPCAGWTLRRLVAHMTAQHHGFAAAARGVGADRTYWIAHDLGGDPLERYAESVRHVLAAFAEDGAVERSFTLPEIGGAFPGRVAVGFHLVDHVAHGWDVATSLGVPLDLPEDVVDAALAVARRVPTGPEHRGPGAAFAPPVPPPQDASPLDETLALLGRTPAAVAYAPVAYDVSRG